MDGVDLALRSLVAHPPLVQKDALLDYSMVGVQNEGLTLSLTLLGLPLTRNIESYFDSLWNFHGFPKGDLLPASCYHMLSRKQ